MSGFLFAALLVSLINHATNFVVAWDDKDFFKHCPPSRCSKHGPEIRFPFLLESSNKSSSCGSPCMKLACSGQDTILAHPLLGPCKVTAIDYRFDIIKLVPLVDSLSPRLLQKLISRTVPIAVVRGLYHQSPCDIYEQIDAILVCCSRELAPSLDAVGPISFLSNTTHLLYLVPAYGLMSNYMSDCVLISDDIVQIPLLSERSYRLPYLNISVTRLLSSAELPQRLEQDLGYNDNYFSGDSCSYCERKGRLCAFSSQRNQTFCMPHGMVSS